MRFVDRTAENPRGTACAVEWLMRGMSVTRGGAASGIEETNPAPL
jgi:hypothetical protein